jgi:hypothetical protein
MTGHQSICFTGYNASKCSLISHEKQKLALLKSVDKAKPTFFFPKEKALYRLLF